MAKERHDREDLLRDASAFAHRVEFRLPGHSETVFCGFRDNGAFSIYWTPDIVFQFNTTGELRRAFWRDRMIASYKQQPHWLISSDTDRVHLRRRELSEEELAEFVQLANDVIDRLRDSLAGNNYEVTGAVSSEDVVARTRQWLQSATVRFALHPGVGR